MFKIGDRIKLAIPNPKYGAGMRKVGDMGIVVEIEDDEYYIEWDNNPSSNWRSTAEAFEYVSPPKYPNAVKPRKRKHV